MSKKIVIAHRGASGYLPEHTIAAKAMAFAMNVDYIEQDIVLSKDNVPIVIHDIYLDDVTNVATKYPDKKRQDGRFYVIDFTFKELKKLSVTERFNPNTNTQVYPKRFPKNKGNFKLHSLEEELELIQGLNFSTQKNIGIYPEIKAPQFHRNEGKDISKIVLQVLSNFGYNSKADKCILQCFDSKELKMIRTVYKSNLYLVQLLETEQDAAFLKHIATYADGIGPWYKQLITTKNNVLKLTPLIANAHKLNLKVHAYTFRADQLDGFSSFKQMLDFLLLKGNLDGVFTDFPDLVLDFLKSKNLK